jgi:hypothetical protein
MIQLGVQWLLYGLLSQRLVRKRVREATHLNHKEFIYVWSIPAPCIS